MIRSTDIIEHKMLPVFLNSAEVQWGIIGNPDLVHEKLVHLLHQSPSAPVKILVQEATDATRILAGKWRNIRIAENCSDLSGISLLVIATGNKILDEKIQAQARAQNILVNVESSTALSDFVFHANRQEDIQFLKKPVPSQTVKNFSNNSESWWKNLASKLTLAFLLMILGHIIISYLPLPGFGTIWADMRPYFDSQFLFFVLAGFLAQMVDGMLSMGYGVTSATCLMSFGVNPVAMSAAIHTSEIFTTGISGYSHYKFGNVNKKLFRHLVIPGVIGAIAGALMLVIVGERYGKFLMPFVAVYAGFLGLKILVKAFQKNVPNKKIKRIGWLAGAGGFFDSFGGGGWGPIVTSNLIAKGRSPRYTIGSVSLTEFFVTMSSAFTFFLMVGISHWNIVLGLLIGGAVAAPIAARLAGKLPRKTMMIAVGIMVMIWCFRMVIRSF